jgi:LPXTG-site transpeptidase (sortase) family protein
MDMRRLSVLIAILVLLGATGATTHAAAATAPAAIPVHLRIPAIKLDQPIVAVGLDPQRRPIVPRHNVGWYTYSARPGQADNVVMWGHVLRWKATPRIPAPFERLAELKLGAEISVTMSDGKVFRYKVKRAVLAKSNEVGYILPTGATQLTLVSCYGNNVIRQGELTKEFRLITIATPIK